MVKFPRSPIKYSVPTESKVQISIYDLLGSEIAVLVNGDHSAGTYSVNWNASEFPSGMYVYRISAVSKDNISFSINKQMLLVK